jgi:hypothetical protein
MLTKGQRVQTPHGTAAVVAFERFNDEGRSIEPSSEDIQGSTSRVIVELEAPSMWAGKGNPYMARREVRAL